MSEDFLAPNPDHIAWDYLVALHQEISSCRRQIREVLHEHRLKKRKNLTINDVPATLEDLRWAFHIFYDSKQEPNFEKKVFDKGDGEIKIAVEDAEKFLKKIKDKLNGVKIPKRPLEVNEWMNR